MQKSINYLKSNNIKYFKIFNYLISLPTTSIHYENLYTKNTKRIDINIPFKKTFNYILILITKY
jgi:hypothetical protein